MKFIFFIGCWLLTINQILCCDVIKIERDAESLEFRCFLLKDYNTAMNMDVVQKHILNDIVDDESTYSCRIELTSSNSKRSKVTTNIDKDEYVNVKLLGITFENSQLSVADEKLIRQTFPNLKAFSFELKHGYEDGKYSRLNHDLLLEFIEFKIFFGKGIDFSNLNSTVGLFNDDMKYVYLIESKISHLGKFLANWKNLIGFYCNDRSVITEALSPDSFMNNPKLKYLTFGDQDFETLPEEILDNLLDLEYFGYINSKKTLKIHENLFQKNSKLTEIDIRWSYLKELPENLFKSLLNLKNLKMVICDITELPQNLFRTNIKLETISLSYNKIQQLDGNLFTNLVNLKKVDLTGNYELKTLPSNLFLNNKNLEELYLGSTKIRKLPSDIFDNNKDIVLGLSGPKSVCIEFNLLSKVKDLYFDCEYGRIEKHHGKEKFMTTRCKCNSIA